MGISEWVSGLLAGLIIGLAVGLRAGAVLAARNARRRAARALAVPPHLPRSDGRQEPEGRADTGSALAHYQRVFLEAAAAEYRAASAADIQPPPPPRPGEVPVLPPVIDYAPIFSDADAPPSPADEAEGPKETP